MTALADIAQALAEDTDPLEPDQEFSIPLDGHRHVHVLRRSGSAGLLLAVSRRFASSEGDEPARREALLRLTADTRWAEGLVGGFDNDGAERVMATRATPLDALQAELLLARMFKRMEPVPESADGPDTDALAASGPVAQGMPAHWVQA
jgi:hypothetical protein